MLFAKHGSRKSQVNLLQPQPVQTESQSEFDLIESFRPTQVVAIVAVLREFTQLKACVHEDGTILYVKKRLATRPFERLKQVVQVQFGELNLEPITHAQFSRLQAKLNDNDSSSAQPTSKTNTDVEHVLSAAIEANASDVYILLHQQDTQLRFRVHGLINEYARYSANDGKHMVRALWSMATSSQFHMETPTDCIFEFAGRRIRGNSLPDKRGCSVVLRLRDPNFRLTLDSLGYKPQQLQAIRDIYDAPNGLSVIGGTTNSGKSTTLTALMAAIDSMQHVIEIADPIEIEFDHITHSEINNYAEDAAETFRAKLAALVRQNPDVLFLGEIRDDESATAAVHMAMQGKKVWSTVHTGDCASTLTRLEILGIQNHQLSAPNFLNGIINQSLIPRLCDQCRVREPLLEPQQHQLQALYQQFDSDQLWFLNPAGCDHCHHGVVGQTVVAEVWPLCWDTERHCQVLIRDRRYQSLSEFAQTQFKLPTKFEHAKLKIRQGLVDPLITQSIVGKFPSEILGAASC